MIPQTKRRRSVLQFFKKQIFHIYFYILPVKSTLHATMPASSLLSNLKLPLIAAPMFLVSGTSLVVSTCKKGALVVFFAREVGRIHCWRTRSHWNVSCPQCPNGRHFGYLVDRNHSCPDQRRCTFWRESHCPQNQCKTSREFGPDCEAQGVWFGRNFLRETAHKSTLGPISYYIPGREQGCHWPGSQLRGVGLPRRNKYRSCWKGH